jgi:hypothetical protein
VGKIGGVTTGGIQSSFTSRSACRIDAGAVTERGRRAEQRHSANSPMASRAGINRTASGEWLI